MEACRYQVFFPRFSENNRKFLSLSAALKVPDGSKQVEKDTNKTCQLHRFELTLHPNMPSAHFSVSLQFSMVPVWSDIETGNSYWVLILCCGFDDAAHSEFEHVSQRRGTLWLHITLKQERNKTVRKVKTKASNLTAASESTDHTFSNLFLIFSLSATK